MNVDVGYCRRRIAADASVVWITGPVGDTSCIDLTARAARRRRCRATRPCHPITEVAFAFFSMAAQVDGGELRTRLVLKIFRLSIAGQRVLDRFDAEVRLHRDRQPPGQNPPAKPVHDGAEIRIPAIGTYVMSIAPDLVGPGDRQLAQEIRKKIL